MESDGHRHEPTLTPPLPEWEEAKGATAGYDEAVALDSVPLSLLPSLYNRRSDGCDRDEYAVSGASREPDQVEAGARAASRMDPGAADRTSGMPDQ